MFSDEWFRTEWRKLGFYYELDHDGKRWMISGTVNGLRGFSQALRAYAEDVENDWVSCHTHLGPYDYLEIGTWNEPVIDGHWIAGRLEDLHALAGHIDAWLSCAEPGDSLLTRAFYSPSSPYDLCLALMGLEFDPASLDDSLPSPDARLS